MLKKVRYSEPIYSGDELKTIELINGAWLSDYDIDDITRNDRYGKGDIRLENPLDLYANSNKEVHYNCNSLNPQLCFMPEYKEIKDNILIQLTYSPPIRDFKFKGIWDFYNGDRTGNNAIENFPYGFIIGSSGRYAYSGWGGYGYAIGANGERRIVNEGVGDNAYTYRYSNYHKIGSDDSFNIVCIGANMRVRAVLSYDKAPYPLYKMSCLNGDFFVVNYDLWNSKIAFIKNGNVVYDDSFTRGQGLRFIRTRIYDVAYTNKEFYIFNKMTLRVLKFNFNMEFSNISFNPVLRSISTHKNGKFSIYRFFGDRVIEFAKNAPLEEYMLPYVVEWNGNLKYDYMIKSSLRNSAINAYISESDYRGHYLRTLGENDSDNEVGKLTGVIDLGYGSTEDFHINDFDDGDLGVDTHLPFRRTILKEHDKIKFTQMSYTRAWRDGIRRIIFYSLNYDNEFGRLYVYEF